MSSSTSRSVSHCLPVKNDKTKIKTRRAAALLLAFPLHYPCNASPTIQLDILSNPSQPSLSQEATFCQVSQVQAVFVVWYNVLAVRKQIPQDPIHSRVSSPSDIRTQAQRRVWSCRTSSYRDNSANTPRGSHLHAAREGQGEE